MFPFRFYPKGNSQGTSSPCQRLVLQGDVAATWISMAHMSAHIFGCRGLRAVVLLEIVQHHGEILLGLVSPSWGRSKEKQNASKWRMPRNNILLQQTGYLTSFALCYRAACLGEKLFESAKRREIKTGLCKFTSWTVIIFLLALCLGDRFVWASRRFEKCCF